MQPAVNIICVSDCFRRRI